MYDKNSWNTWDKKGNNKKVFAYTIYMLLMESIQDEPGEFYNITRSY